MPRPSETYCKINLDFDLVYKKPEYRKMGEDIEKHCDIMDVEMKKIVETIEHYLKEHITVIVNSRTDLHLKIDYTGWTIE